MLLDFFRFLCFVWIISYLQGNFWTAWGSPALHKCNYLYIKCSHMQTNLDFPPNNVYCAKKKYAYDRVANIIPFWSHSAPCWAREVHEASFAVSHAKSSEEIILLYWHLWVAILTYVQSAHFLRNVFSLYCHKCFQATDWMVMTFKN